MIVMLFGICMIEMMFGMVFVVVVLNDFIVVLKCGGCCSSVMCMLGNVVFSVKCVVLFDFDDLLICGIWCLISLKLVGCFSVILLGMGSFDVLVMSVLYVVVLLFFVCVMMLLVVVSLLVGIF